MSTDHIEIPSLSEMLEQEAAGSSDQGSSSSPPEGGEAHGPPDRAPAAPGPGSPTDTEPSAQEPSPGDPDAAGGAPEPAAQGGEGPAEGKPDAGTPPPPALGGYPKPPFDPNALEGEAAEVQRYWHTVLSIKGQEVGKAKKALEEKYAGLDPDAAAQAVQSLEFLQSHPRWQQAWAVIDDAHPDHVRLMSALEGAPPAVHEMTPTDVLLASMDEDGVIDQEKYERLARARDDAIAARGSRGGSSTESGPNGATQPGGASPGANKAAELVWKAWAKSHDVDPGDLAHYEQIAQDVFGGKMPPKYRGDPEAWLDVLHQFRKTELSTQMARVREQSKAAGSIPRPSTTAPAPPPTLKPKFAGEVPMLREFQQLEREGKI